MDLAVNLEPNLFRDEYTLSVMIKAIRLSNVDEDGLFSQIENYDNLMSHREGDPASALPSREEVGVLYKNILNKPFKLERIKHINLNNLGYAKTMVAVKTLLELGLVTEKDGILFGVKGAPKTELTNSETYNYLVKEAR